MEIDTGDTAWLLMSSALVLLMTPGLAFFYGGMVRMKNVLNMIMMSFACIGIVSLLWVAFGYSLTFTGTNPFIGTFEAVGLSGTIDAVSGTTPELAFVAFQMMFAIITPALISGAIADRAKFGAWVVFAALWATLVYFPVARWVFYFNDGQGGWIADKLQALDFAGGTAVHINAGAAALALTFILGRRRGWGKDPMRPHNLPLVVLGAGLLWFGWFGFNAGSALAANGLAAIAFVNTQVATAAAAMAWIVVDKVRDGHSTTLGVASGAVAGLVAITPACASVNPIGAIVVGVAAGVLCSLAIGLKFKFGYDDSLDVVGVHLVGGLVGTLLIGFLATATVTGGVNGLFFGGGLTQLGKQAVAAGAVLGYSFVVTFIIGTIVDRVIGFRVSEEDEETGLDVVTHAETGYELGPMGAGVFSPSRSATSTATHASSTDADRSVNA